MTHPTPRARRPVTGGLAVLAAAVLLAGGLVLGAEFSADQPLAPALVAGSFGLVAVLLGRWGLRTILPRGLHH